ncbi:MAG: hypothetical protein JWQ01_4814 [Massilia sp.]|nr:hypothetical protein [Massilia sp.]
MQTENGITGTTTDRRPPPGPTPQQQINALAEKVASLTAANERLSADLDTASFKLIEAQAEIARLEAFNTCTDSALMAEKRECGLLIQKLAKRDAADFAEVGVGIRNVALEQAMQACEAEKVDAAATKSPQDEAYNTAIAHCRAAISALKGVAAPIAAGAFPPADLYARIADLNAALDARESVITAKSREIDDLRKAAAALGEAGADGGTSGNLDEISLIGAQKIAALPPAADLRGGSWELTGRIQSELKELFVAYRPVQATSNFRDEADLIAMLQSLHAGEPNGAVSNWKWDVAQRAIAGILSKPASSTPTAAGVQVAPDGFWLAPLVLPDEVAALGDESNGDTITDGRAFVRVLYKEIRAMIAAAGAPK